MKRREFLLSSAALVSGTRRLAQAESRPQTSLSAIVDTHQHLWDLQQFHLPWLKPGGQLTRNFTLSDYQEATAGLGIGKAIYMEVAVAPEQKQAEAAHVIGICRDSRNPTCAAVIGGLVLEPSFKDYISSFRDNPFIKGVRHGLNRPEQLEDDQLIKNLRLLGSLDMRFDLLVPPRLIGRSAQLAGQCPHTQFILDHCGNADPLAFSPQLDWGRPAQHDAEQWKRDMDELARHKNVICKISGIIARVPTGQAAAETLSPIVNHCLDAFGPERVVYGSDWPVCTRGASLRTWTTLLREIVAERPYTERHALFWSNACRIYGLS